MSIDLNFALLMIDDHINIVKNPWIRFYDSGEATIRIDVIKKLQPYCKNKYPDTKIIFELQTNGYFSKDIACYIRDNFDKIFIF